jgi:hypothetical protein
MASTALKEEESLTCDQGRSEPLGDSLSRGNSLKRLGVAACLAAVSLTASASPAAASVTIGQLSPGSPPVHCSPNAFDHVQPTVTSGNPYVVPGTGMITLLEPQRRLRTPGSGDEAHDEGLPQGRRPGHLPRLSATTLAHLPLACSTLFRRASR